CQSRKYFWFVRRTWRVVSATEPEVSLPPSRGFSGICNSSTFVFPSEPVYSRVTFTGVFPWADTESPVIHLVAVTIAKVGIQPSIKNRYRTFFMRTSDLSTVPLFSFTSLRLSSLSPQTVTD